MQAPSINGISFFILQAKMWIEDVKMLESLQANSIWFSRFL